MSCQQVPRLVEDPYTFTDTPATTAAFFTTPVCILFLRYLSIRRCKHLFFFHIPNVRSASCIFIHILNKCLLFPFVTNERTLMPASRVQCQYCPDRACVKDALNELRQIYILFSNSFHSFIQIFKSPHIECAPHTNPYEYSSETE